MEAIVEDEKDIDRSFGFFFFFFLLLVAVGTRVGSGQSTTVRLCAAGSSGLALCGEEYTEGLAAMESVDEDGRFRFLCFLALPSCGG